jgi:hypothetical protein
MHHTSPILLEIQVDRMNEKGVFIASQILNILHDALEYGGFFKKTLRPVFHFEIAAVGGKIRFFLLCEREYVSFIANQFYAQYPSIDIIERTDYIPEKLWYTQLELHHFTYDPIKIYTEFSEKTETDVVDPFSALTSALVPDPKRMEIIQVSFSPLHNKEWRTEGQVKLMSSHMLPRFVKQWFVGEQHPLVRLLKKPFEAMLTVWGGHHSAEGEAKPEKKPTGSTRKTQDFGFNVSLAVACTGPDALTAKTRIKEICRSVNIFASPKENQFHAHPVHHDMHGHVKHRSLKRTNILAASELAGLVHLPTIYVKTPNINWMMSKKFEPPHNLPRIQKTKDKIQNDKGDQSHGELTPIWRTNFRNQSIEFGSRPDDRRRHFYVIGKTGMGKSTLLENMIFDDIAKGRGVGVIDPHGDLAEKVLDFIPKTRTNDVIIFSPADTKYPIAFNLFENVSRELAPVVAGGFVNIFKRMFEDSWGPRLEYILRNTVLTLLEVPGSTMLDITKILTNKIYREKISEKVKDPVLSKFWIEEFNQWQPKQMQEAIGPILNKVGQFLSSYMVRNMVAQPKNSFGLRWAMDKGKIVIMNLSKGLIGEDASNMLGAMLVTKFQIDAMSRADIPEKERKDFYLYVDEFQNFATSSFATILSEARKYKLNLTMANQYIEQMSEEVRGAVFWNVGTLVTFQVGHEDAKVLAPALGNEELILPDDLMNLAKYQIYTKFLIDWMPSQVFSARTNPPVDVSDREFYQDKTKLIDNSRQRYAKEQEKVEKTIQ